MTAVAERAPVTLRTCRLDAAREGPLDATERARAARLVFERDRLRFLRARAFLRAVLGERLDLDPAMVPIEAPDGAKPHVPGAALDFSLSHSGDLMVVALVERGRVGVDLEALARAPATDGLARLCLTDPERAALRGCPERFLEFWTAKEARMKLDGHGMALDPRAIRLALSGGRPVGYEGEPEIALERVRAHDGAVCHVATRP